MKRLSLIVILISTCIFQKSFAQRYVTNNPYVQSTNVSWCKIARVEIYEDKTKILVQIPSQKKGRPWVSFSEWTTLIETVSGKEFENEGTFEIPLSNEDFPKLNTTVIQNPVLYDVWKKAKSNLESNQQTVKEGLGSGYSWGEWNGCLIKDLGNDKLNVKYSIKSKEPKTYSFWLTFPKIPEGIESISIYEFGENGFRWRGIKIKNPDQTPRITENEIKNNWRSDGHDLVEGIYEVVSGNRVTKYKLAVIKANETLKKENVYKLIYLSGGGRIWKEGNIKAVLKKTATPNLYKGEWYMADKSLSNDPIVSFERGKMKVLWTDDGQEDLYLKLYPYSEDGNVFNSKITSSGTGFAISSNGYIVTNQHVVEGASKISVRGIKGEFSHVYNAKVIVEDKNNDLAIIKIDDMKFKSLGTPPYKISNSLKNVGNSVYTLGYPLRASMGNEVKLTNGIISSKTGYQGDITTYQITVPVQAGNSGGPLFDSKGNVVGIVNAKHSGAENASYAIKTSYLRNLIQVMTTVPKLPKVNKISKKDLSNQVKQIKDFIYIIETE